MILSKKLHTKQSSIVLSDLSRTKKALILIGLFLFIFLGGCLHQGSYEQGCLRLCDGLEERKRPFVNVFTLHCGC